MIISGNQQLLRTINRLAVLRAIRLNKGISRVKLADRLKLTRPTIGNLVDELIADGWLTEEKLGPTGSLGRRPVALHIDEASRILIGADINNQRVICVATTLEGEVRELSVTPTESGDADRVLDILASQVVSLWHRLCASGCKVSAMGIGVPGQVDAATGTLRYSESTGWNQLPVRDMLQARLHPAGIPDFPLLVQRAVGCIALYHFEYERREEEEPLLYVHVGNGVTAAVATSYSLMQGHNGMMGTIGHFVMDPEGPPCRCGKRGCANTLISLQAVQKATGRPISEFRAANLAGDPILARELRTAGQHFGTMLHNLSMVFKPARLFVGGPALQVDQAYLQAAQDSFTRLQASGTRPPIIELVRNESNAVALGAATGALYALVRPLR
ncbi:MAG: family transcriptional regulator [Proteobacteria bacterium]|nr:family transcriptional regulator [Pseudomonadota bacterium]